MASPLAGTHHRPKNHPLCCRRGMSPAPSTASDRPRQQAGFDCKFDPVILGQIHTAADNDGTLGRIHYALYVKCREKAEREASPTACIIDSQSVKSAEKG